MYETQRLFHLNREKFLIIIPLSRVFMFAVVSSCYKQDFTSHKYSENDPVASTMVLG